MSVSDTDVASVFAHDTDVTCMSVTCVMSVSVSDVMSVSVSDVMSDSVIDVTSVLLSVSVVSRVFL